MRIALFTGNYNYVREGANQALNRLVDYLEGERGDRVRVYSPVTDRPAFAPVGTLVPVPSVTLPIRTEFQLALGLPRAIRRDIACFSPDIVHVATPDLLGTGAQTLARRQGIAIVASLHTRFETYPAYYGLGWARPLVEAHLRRFYRRSDHVLVPTEALRDDLTRLRGDGHVSVWSRGVDRELFNPARRDLSWRRAQGLADEEIVILFFGRLVLEKGVEEFVSTVGKLQQRGVRARALVVGAGPAAEAFQSLPGAVLTGHIDEGALARAVASADILLHPSTTETFGNVVLEAMASGLAIVAADAPSARALIRDDQSGIIYPAGDVEVAGTAIEALARSPARRQALGGAARNASESYSWAAASKSVGEAYEQVLKDRGRCA